MKLPFFYLASCILVNASINGLLFSQTPLNDLNWQLDTAKSDEFNGNSVNTAKWHILDCPSGDCCNYGGATAFEKGDVSDSGGYLRLRVDGRGYAPIPCNRETFATGGIISDSANYPYGYFEISAKLPGWIDSSGIAHADKFWPTFWMARVIFDTTCQIVHDEIDIMDECCCIYKDAETIGSGWSSADRHCSSIGLFQYLTNSTPLCNSFNKLAVEWNSDRIIFYFNDTPYFTTLNNPRICTHPQQVYIDQQLSNACNFYPGTPFPQYMTVDYFRYYKLKQDCFTSVYLYSNAALAAFNYSVKSDITFGDGTDTISLKSTDVKYFRAVNSITINGTFTAPLGAELGLIPTACN